METRFSIYPANLDGTLTEAKIAWTASPCPAALKLKVFRPSVLPFRWDSLPPAFEFVSERGPFDVIAPVLPFTNLGFSFTGFASQTVALDPPMEVHAGDVLAITNLTQCGGPVFTLPRPLGAPVIRGGSFAVPGDVSASIQTPAPSPLEAGGKIIVEAEGPSLALGFFTVTEPSCGCCDANTFCDLARFAVTLRATDPRTGERADGTPNALSQKSGYFGFPAFTGDPGFPEVMVKMVDATGSPQLGGNSWFFYAPLTDAEYTITVKDQWRGTLRMYSNVPGSAVQLCGEADTNAFPP